jgi:hypothetical protein
VPVSDLSAYHDLISRKRVAFEPRGLDRWRDLPAGLFPHQAHGVEFALRAGCSALFYDTGLGKTAMSLTWGERIVEAANKPVLMLAPLAVGHQHAKEAERLGVEAKVVRDGAEVKGAGVWITNYDRLEKFDPDAFAGVILDESSILKSFTGSTQRALTRAFAQTPYRLAASATPAPNDHTELGQHSNYLGVMAANEMLSRWFIADQTQMGHYRLKRHGVRPFWDWVASWARCVSKPSDLGFSDDGFELPPLDVSHVIVRADLTIDAGAEKDGQARLFRMPEVSATSIHREKKLSLAARADALLERVLAEPDEAWALWCETNDEADALMARLPKGAAVEVRGSQSPEEKEEKLAAFSSGAVRNIVTKPSIAGFGLNWQHCARTGFIGLSFSYEMFYQALRRFWRFGQRRRVEAFLVGSDAEKAIFDTLTRKAGDHETMKLEMAAAMARAARSSRVYEPYDPRVPVVFPDWLRTAA